MRTLTPAQQEIIDLINQGWELGSYHGLNPRSTLQKGGIGKGGETKNVLPSTVYALEYLGYIERGESDHLVLRWKLKTAKPITPEIQTKSDPLYGDNFQHPSFGTISFNQAQGSSNALFGSSIKHNHVIIMRICHAERHNSNGVDHVFSKGVIVEAYMSPTQFADAITHAGSGGEAPITIQFIEKEGRIEQPVFNNKRIQFEKEFYKRAGELVNRVNETIEKAKDKKVAQWLVKDLDIFNGWLKSNIPFLAEQFAEQMDKTVTEAKAEVEAYVNSMIIQTGLNALQDMKPQITDGQDDSKQIEMKGANPDESDKR